MILLALTLLLIVIGLVVTWYWRDKRFLKADLEDVASLQVKKELNFKTQNNTFERTLTRGNQEKVHSNRILARQNQKNDEK